MEALSSLSKRAKERGSLLGWRLCGRKGVVMEISHLLFADDTLVLCELSLDQMTYLSWLLMWFEVMSRLRVNFKKSELISIRRVENVLELAQNFGCRFNVLLSFYLGAQFKYVAVWDGMEERLQKRLSILKR